MEYTTKDLVAINQRIADLKDKRSEIMKALGRNRRADSLALSDEQLLVYNFIWMNPGTTRQEIAKLLPNHTDQQMIDILTVLRRNRHLVENRGTLIRGAWYAL